MRFSHTEKPHFLRLNIVISVLLITVLRQIVIRRSFSAARCDQPAGRSEQLSAPKRAAPRPPPPLKKLRQTRVFGVRFRAEAAQGAGAENCTKNEFGVSFFIFQSRRVAGGRSFRTYPRRNSHRQAAKCKRSSQLLYVTPPPENCRYIAVCAVLLSVLNH